MEKYDSLSLIIIIKKFLKKDNGLVMTQPLFLNHKIS